jgi:hypothetical protein
MTSIENTHARPLFEDLIIFKAVACVPVVGLVAQMGAESFLKNKIEEEFHASPYVAKLIKVKNDYKICGIINNVISMALLVAGFAMGAFPAIGFVFIVAGALFITNTVTLMKNLIILKEVKQKIANAEKEPNNLFLNVSKDDFRIFEVY